MKTVINYVTKNIVKIQSSCSVLDAISLMREHKVSSLLVDEPDGNIGIFTERDLLSKVDFSAEKGLANMQISEVMTKDLTSANFDRPYIDVLEMMQKSQIRHMPVKQNGEIVGIVSLRDLLNHYYENLDHLLGETVTALSSAVEKRDPYTAGHQRRVAQLACAIAEALNLTEKQVSGVHMASVIHDIGKMYVPAEILNKPGKLLEAEMTLIKVHPMVGYEILKPIDFPWPIADMVLQHHERLDGSGYPHGLSGDKIIYEAKIIAVADVVEAIASHRPYRPALGMDVAIDEIEKNKNKFYEPQIVDVCVNLIRNKNFQFT